MKRNKRMPLRLLAIALSLAVMLSFTACVDLGIFNAEDDYQSLYDSIGEVEGLFDGGSHGYALKASLFNSYSVETLGWEDDDDKVASEEYVYIVIPFEAALEVESVALFMNSADPRELEISAFYFESSTLVPEKIKYKSSPETEIVVIDEVETEREIIYDDPAKSDRIADAFCYANADWESFVLDHFAQKGYTDGYLHTGIGGSLYLRIENNSGLNKEMQSCFFNFNGLLIRAV